MLAAVDYPFLNIFWTMMIFFFWVAWIVILVRVLGDVFRRHDIGGGKKTAWVIFLICVPFLGVFAYLLAHGNELGTREAQLAQASSQARFDDYAVSAGGNGGSSGPAQEITAAKQLLDSGAIDQAEFDMLKAKALA